MTAPNDLPPVLTAQETADLLRVKLDKVYELAATPLSEGGLPQLRRVGARLRFSRDDVVEWLKGES